MAETSGYHHVLVGLSATDGTVQVERDIPTPDGQPRYDQQRPGLAIEDGRVYVAFGGLYGDCGPYRGSVVGIPLSGAGPMLSYLVPTAREGAIWGTAGPVIGPDGTLYVSVGNGSVTSTKFDGSDSVTALSPALKQTGIFAPSSWYHDSQNDLDLGSTQPALLASGMLLARRQERHRVPDQRGPSRRRRRAGRAGSRLPRVRRGRGPGSTVYEPCEQGGMAAISTAGDKTPRAVARAGQRLGLPGRRRRGGLGHRLDRGDAVRAQPGHRRDPPLAEPGHLAAALLLDVHGRPPRLSSAPWTAWSRSAWRLSQDEPVKPRGARDSRARSGQRI